jgi:hypothetical protein
MDLVPSTKDQKSAKAPDEFPEWWPKEAWKEFLLFRKKQKKPLTPEAIQRAIARLTNLRNEGNDPTRVLSQAIDRGWSGLFPLEGAPVANVRAVQRSPGADLGRNPASDAWSDAEKLAEIRARQAAGKPVTKLELELADSIERSEAAQRKMQEQIIQERRANA